MSDRIKTWIQTHPSCSQFFPLEPDFSKCNAKDQSHAMSNLCRYGGHCDPAYSVAEHAVRVSRRVEELATVRGYPPGMVRGLAQWALIHDNSEGCGFVDIPRPVKIQLPEYKALEHAMVLKVAAWYKLDPFEPEIVTEVDTDILGTEARQLKAPVHEEWHRTTTNGQLPAEWPGAKLGWSNVTARYWWRRRFLRLFGEGWGLSWADVAGGPP